MSVRLYDRFLNGFDVDRMCEGGIGKVKKPNTRKDTLKSKLANREFSR